jgi:hypothetical protein
MVDTENMIIYTSKIALLESNKYYRNTSDYIKIINLIEASAKEGKYDIEYGFDNREFAEGFSTFLKTLGFNCYVKESQVFYYICIGWAKDLPSIVP